MSSYILTSPIDIYLSGSQSQINLYNSAGTFSSQIVAPASLTANIDFTLPSTSGSTKQFLQRTGASSLGWSTLANSSPYYPIEFRMYQSSTAAKTTTSSTPQVCCSFYFPGTTVLGASPSRAFCLGSIGTSGDSFRIQLVDLTAGSVVLGFQNSFPTVGVITRATLTINSLLVTATPAIWQFRYFRQLGTGTVTIYYAAILF